MFPVLTAIAAQHDPNLRLVALVICVVSAATGLSIYARAAATHGAAQVGWSAFAGVVAGCGVWATHFMAMMAYQPKLTVAYGLNWRTPLSALAVLAIGAGIYVAARGAGRIRTFGGAVMGAGVVAMEVVNLNAMAATLAIVWNPVFLAIAVGVALTAAAAAFGVAGNASSPPRRWGAAALLVVAIYGLHVGLIAAVAQSTAVFRAALAAGPDDLPMAADVVLVVGLVVASAIATLVISQVSGAATLNTLRAALDEAPSAIGFFDSKQRLTFWNQPYAKLFEVFGLKPAVGLGFDTILAAATAAGVPYRVTPESAHAGAFSWDNPPDELELPDGRVIHAKVGPTRDGGMVAVLLDVTLTRQAEKDAHVARERAEAANRLKSDFLATMGHEIRTPLNGVLGMAQVMAAGPLEPAQRERLEIIKTSGESLLTLLNDMLDLAKIEAGYMKLEDSAFDLEGVLRLACDGFAAMAAEKGVNFDLSIDPAAAGSWRGDAHRLRQVVANLVANAVKFTTVGAVGVAVDATERGLRIAVRDTGIGMKPEQIPQLFEKFTQADSTSTRKFGGTGLGLAICRELTELMGGTLSASSVEGEGSIFTFEAPLAPVARAEPAHCETAAKPALKGRLRILAAEDNLINQKVLAALLSFEDAELVFAADGEEAVEAYRSGGFDVVLMDIRMPNMGGVEATKAIREWEAQRGLARVPILALTANLMTHHVAGYLAAGMDGVIAKPIEAHKLLSALAEVSPLAQAA